MGLLSSLFKFVKETFNEISIEIDVMPTDTASLEIQVEVETGEYLYSRRLSRWFHFSEITPLGTIWGEDEAAITRDGLILFAFECVWDDGVMVSDVTIPEFPTPVKHFRKNDGLIYETGW